MNTVYVLIHYGNDFFAANAIIESHYPNVRTLIVNYNSEFPYTKVPDGVKLVLVGVKYKESVMANICSEWDVEVYDNRPNAIEELMTSNYTCQVHADDSMSLCEQVWSTLYPDKEVPDTFRWIGDYAMWNLKLPESLPFFYGLGLHDLSPYNRKIKDLWTRLVNDDVETKKNTLARGRQIEEYITLRDKTISNDTTYRGEFNGHTATFANIAGVNSLFFENVKKTNPTDVYITYRWNANMAQWQYTLFSADENRVDVGSIAKLHGGGGKPGVAAFKSKTLVHVQGAIPHKDKCTIDKYGPIKDILHRSNAVKLYNNKFDKGILHSVSCAGYILGHRALFVNTPYTWFDVFANFDTSEYGVLVAWSWVNSGHYRLVIHNIANVDMEEIRANLKGEFLSEESKNDSTSTLMDEIPVVCHLNDGDSILPPYIKASESVDDFFNA